MKLTILILFLIAVALLIWSQRIAHSAGQDDFSFVIPAIAGLAMLGFDLILLFGYALSKVFA